MCLVDAAADEVVDGRLTGGIPGMVSSTPPEPSEAGNGADLVDNQDGTAEKVRPSMAVRFGQMRNIGEFVHPAGLKASCGARMVIQTKRGIEIGEYVPLGCDGGDESASREGLKRFVSASGPEYLQAQAGRVLREATAADLAEYDRIIADADDKRRFCQNLAEQHNLEMRVVSCEPLFGGERIIFYFVAEERVDFRNLVKDLAHEFQTRIEMRQVGARDEARLVADFETCGRECCCRSFLKNLKPVSMKMAKMQKATLDPSKVSGRCGRLKCCLRYEHSSYEELERQLPRMGTRVRTQRGTGAVVSRQILTQLLQIQTEAGGRIAVAVEEILGPDDGTTPEMPEPPRADQKGAARESGPRSPGDGVGRQEGTEGGRGGRRRSRRSSPASGRKADAAPEAPEPSPDEEQAPSSPPRGKGDEQAARGQGGGKRRRRRRPPRRGQSDAGKNAPAQRPADGGGGETGGDNS